MGSDVVGASLRNDGHREPFGKYYLSQWLVTVLNHGVWQVYDLEHRFGRERDE